MTGPSWSRCIRCEAEGYDIAPLGKPRKNGVQYPMTLCRVCLRDPARVPLQTEASRRGSRESMRRLREERHREAMRALRTGAILGPCPCHDCGTMVSWNGWWWLDAKGFRHVCGRARMDAATGREASAATLRPASLHN